MGYFFLKRYVIYKKIPPEEKYTVPEIVDLLKEVNIFPTVIFSKKFYVQLVREVIANMPEKFGDARN